MENLKVKSDEESQELIDINFKELNLENYSIKKHKRKKGKGNRPFSPWYYFTDRINRRYLNKKIVDDFDVTKFVNIKLQKKKKDLGKIN